MTSRVNLENLPGHSTELAAAPWQPGGKASAVTVAQLEA